MQVAVTTTEATVLAVLTHSRFGCAGTSLRASIWHASAVGRTGRARRREADGEAGGHGDG